MPYEYLEDSVTSDITFRASGRNLDELFAAAADATLNVMVAALDTVAPVVTVVASVDAEALDLLLMRLLDELIFYKDAEALLLRAASVHVEQLDHVFRAGGQLRGEKLDPNKHQLVVDVKAVTLHGLRVEQTPAGWEAQVTLDV